MENPDSLVLWEAQLKDFANTAQVRFCFQGLASNSCSLLLDSALRVLHKVLQKQLGADGRFERFLGGVGLQHGCVLL
jgi:2-oxoglutarate dehydrogenase complex dehydrogenase (E1) component-like enzyme